MLYRADASKAALAVEVYEGPGTGVGTAAGAGLYFIGTCGGYFICARLVREVMLVDAFLQSRR